MRLLLAEDEIELSNALVMILQHNNYSVDPVYNGQDAYDYIMSGNYDGVILDVMMPKMDGFTVLQKIRKEGCQIPVIILTARAEVDDRVTGLDYGADDYLSKPFATKELLARIRAMLRRKDTENKIELGYGNVILDNMKFEIRTPFGYEHLSNKEYQIFEMMLTNKNMVLSLDMMMDRIWGFDTETDSNVVWVNISNLRKKLKKIKADIQIKAVRNQGYILEILS